MSLSWQGADTPAEAAQVAAAAVHDVAVARRWWAQPVDAAGVALGVAQQTAGSDVGAYWSALSVAWDEAGRSIPIDVPGWSNLAGVWTAAAEAHQAELDAEDAQSLRALVAGGLSGSVKDAGSAADKLGGIATDALGFAHDHPGWTAGILAGGYLALKTLPVALARLLVR